MHKQGEEKYPTITESALSLRDIEALYEYVERRDDGEPGFLGSIACMYKRNAMWSNKLVRYGVCMFAWVLRPKKCSVKYFFWGTKYAEIILGLPRSQVCVIGGPKQLLFCLKHRVPFFVNMNLWKVLARDIGAKRTEKGNRKLAKLITDCARKLKNIAIPEAVIVVDNDSLPMQRSLILSARAANFKTICIQHGIFQNKSPAYVMDGWFADLFLAINENQRNMLIAKGMDSRKIKIMGFHSSPYLPKRPTAPAGQRKVCFLGQPWNKYGHKRFSRYMEIISNTAEILRKAGIEMSFKPHPWERGEDHLKHIANVVDISLSKAIEEYDVFISLTSTALIEAQSAGRVAIQIMDDAFDADDLSVHGNISVVDANAEDNFQESLLIALSAPASPPAAIPSAAIRFKSVL